MPPNSPFIIAEVGSNWTDLADCMTSIAQAKACGADAVKFQLFTPEALYGMRVAPQDSLGLSEAARTLVVDGALPLEWLSKLKEKADACGIEFMCSAFSPELIEAVDPFVKRHKVASAECTHKRMLEKLAWIGKPVILSTGAHRVEDIKAALSILRAPVMEHGQARPPYPQCEVTLLYCVAAYPANDVDLRFIPHYREVFNLPVGFSDHTTDMTTIPALAAAVGAVVIEKHVTFINADTPDRPHSLDGHGFKTMVDHLRGDKTLRSPATGERPMILQHNRRLIATKAVAQGSQFVEGENFGIYRSLKDETHAFHPFMIDEVNGRTALREIRAGDGIGPGDI